MKRRATAMVRSWHIQLTQRFDSFALVFGRDGFKNPSGMNRKANIARGGCRKALAKSFAAHAAKKLTNVKACQPTRAPLRRGLWRFSARNQCWQLSLPVQVPQCSCGAGRLFQPISPGSCQHLSDMNGWIHPKPSDVCNLEPRLTPKQERGKATTVLRLYFVACVFPWAGVKLGNSARKAGIIMNVNIKHGAATNGFTCEGFSNKRSNHHEK